MIKPRKIHDLPWAAVILSAGKSARMNDHKALLRYDSGHNFIGKIVTEYAQAGCNHIIVVANESNIGLLSRQFNYIDAIKPDFILNEHLEYERFYSIKLGVAACMEYSKCFIQPCDNPFITHDLLKKMLQCSSDECFIAPIYKGKKGHPVLLGTHIMKELCEVKENDLNFKEFLRRFKCLELDTDNRNILVNINDTEDYQRFFSSDDENIRNQ
ncbi:MAG TPA: NTP transferase domain-containing protein [Bacteroidales bacterium]|nr:NTP transferase domain-containing protein [Bacteroidales bacterium]